MMGLFSNTLAFIVALAVAILPLAGANARGLKPAGVEPTATAAAHATHAAMHASILAAGDSDQPEVSAPLHVDHSASALTHDCCPDPGDPGQADKRCQSMLACAQCVGLSNVAFSDFAYPSLRREALSVAAEQAAPLSTGSPPDRPPRL